MILVRTGPRYLFLKTKNKSHLMFQLEKEFASHQKPLKEAFEESNEGDTIIFFIENEEGKQQISIDQTVLLVRRGSTPVLLSIVNHKELQDSVEIADMGPGQVVMKVPTADKKIVEKVKKEFEGYSTSLLESIRSGQSDWSVVCFTSSHLSRPLSSASILEECVLIKRRVRDVYHELRLQAVKYVTEELEEGSWRELTINIYDSNSRYNIQYERVTTVIEDLELGFILGETWSVDQPFVLMSVPVYQIRLFTYMEPKEVKKIMMSLEYNASGNRVVDLDLYYRRKKVQWGEMDKKKKENRKDIGLLFREEYLTKLSSIAHEKLLRLEKELEEYEELGM